MDKVLKVYKGTDKDMKCHGGYQYELGKKETDTGAIRCGNKGFHSCEAPFDVLRYFPLRDGNRYFTAEASGVVDLTDTKDSKIASSELKIKTEIGIVGLIKAQIKYTKRKAESGENGGDSSNRAGGYRSNLAGGDGSNLAGGNESNLAGGDGSNLAGGYRSNLAGGDGSNLAGGNESNLAGGNRSNLAGGDESNLAGGESSLILGRNGCRVKGGKNSVIVLTEWILKGGEYVPVCVKSEIVDGERIKADTWYELKDGEFRESGEK